MTEGWEQRAAQWLAWARTPGHDAYWACRDALFELLPRPSGRALDVGCGEGRVSRDLSACGYRVTGLDATRALPTSSETHTSCRSPMRRSTLSSHTRS